MVIPSLCRHVDRLAAGSESSWSCCLGHPLAKSGSGMITVGVACAKFRMARIEDSSGSSAFSEVYNFTTVLAFSSSALLSNLGRVQGATLLDLAKRWITPHVPAAAQSAEGTYSSTSCIRARAFDLVAATKSCLSASKTSVSVVARPCRLVAKGRALA